MIAPCALASSTSADTLSSWALLLMGPYITPSPIPSPMIASARVATFVISFTNASYTFSWTYTRLMAQQICPEFAIAPKKTLGATTSTSTSSRTIAASFPPISSVIRFTSLAAHSKIFFPVAVDPVNDTLRTSRCADRYAPMFSAPSSGPLTTLKTPGGKTSARISPISSIESGVKGEGLRTTVLPSTIAAAHFWSAVKSG
mmetsp:Transcript_7110/g.18510  ORF Transcript_7110/g.18510 Transcript_7110/m.18510 type:complete len:201 (+) Transcript_7110:682-1284(+)